MQAEMQPAFDRLTQWQAHKNDRVIFAAPPQYPRSESQIKSQFPSGGGGLLALKAALSIMARDFLSTAPLACLQALHCMLSRYPLLVSKVLSPLLFWEHVRKRKRGDTEGKRRREDAEGKKRRRVRKQMKKDATSRLLILQALSAMGMFPVDTHDMFTWFSIDGKQSC